MLGLHRRFIKLHLVALGPSHMNGQIEDLIENPENLEQLQPAEDCQKLFPLK